MAACALVGSLTTLLGWALGLPRLTDWDGNGISMFPNTALCAGMSGLALILARRRAVVRTLGTLVATVGGLTLFEHLSGVNLGIDTLLSDQPWGQAAAAAPMRMGPPACTSFSLIGTALMLLPVERGRARSVAAGLAAAAVGIASLSLLGYLYGAPHLYMLPRLTAIALQTAMMIACLGIGLVASVPERGITALLRRDDTGGAMVRRLLPLLILAALVLGWLRVAGQNAGLYDTAFGTAARSIVEIVLFVALLWWTANGLSRAERDIAAAHERYERDRELSLAAERAARAEAERAGRMKDEFLATLSHELRTPLNAILGWAQVLSKGAHGEEVRQGAATIERNARAQAQLIDDLLDMSRIISGKVRLEIQPIALEEVVDAALAVTRPAAEAKGIRLDKMLDPRAGVIRADPHRLQQVLWNLLSNAIKFSETGGQVTVRVERLDSHVALSVSDTGRGIAPEFLPYVFERFRQQDGSTTRRHGGLGLGLAIVKQLVELHGGKISVHSAGHGHGSSFTFVLPTPAAPPAPDSDEAERVLLAARPGVAAAEPPHLDGLKVLVVAAEPDAVNLVKRVLEAAHAVVTTATSAGEALERFAADRPDVLVSDISMPQQDGYALIRAIRHAERDSATMTPAVALTALARPEDRLRVLREGYQVHMAKPFDPAELTAVVASVSGRS
jgi:signal transduction histidine kinase/CheY-like chemotaxis protein